MQLRFNGLDFYLVKNTIQVKSRPGHILDAVCSNPESGKISIHLSQNTQNRRDAEIATTQQ